MEEKRTSKVLLVLALIATVFYLFPFLLMLLNSLKTTGEFTSNPFAMPAAIQWGNYPYAIEQMHFLTSLKNSLVLTVAVCALIVSSVIGLIKKGVKKPWHAAFAVAAFVLVGLIGLSPVYVVVACAVLSFIFGKKVNKA